MSSRLLGILFLSPSTSLFNAVRICPNNLSLSSCFAITSTLSGLSFIMLSNLSPLSVNFSVSCMATSSGDVPFFALTKTSPIFSAGEITADKKCPSVDVSTSPPSFSFTCSLCCISAISSDVVVLETEVT